MPRFACQEAGCLPATSAQLMSAVISTACRWCPIMPCMNRISAAVYRSCGKICRLAGGDDATRPAGSARLHDWHGGLSQTCSACEPAQCGSRIVNARRRSIPSAASRKEQVIPAAAGEHRHRAEELRERQRLDEPRHAAGDEITEGRAHEPDAHHLAHVARR